MSLAPSPAPHTEPRDAPPQIPHNFPNPHNRNFSRPAYLDDAHSQPVKAKIRQGCPNHNHAKT